MNMPNWKKKFIEKTMIYEITKMNNKIEKSIDPIIEALNREIENWEEKKQINAVVIICSHLIAGFETKKTREEAIEMVKMVISNL